MGKRKRKLSNATAKRVSITSVDKLFELGVDISDNDETPKHASTKKTKLKDSVELKDAHKKRNGLKKAVDKASPESKHDKSLFTAGVRVQTTKMKSKKYRFQYGTVLGPGLNPERVQVRFDKKEIDDGNILFENLTLVLLEESEEDASNDESASEMETDDEPQESEHFTVQKFQVLTDGLEKQLSPSGLKRLAKVFRACCLYGTSEEQGGGKRSIILADSDVFDVCTKFCLENIPTLLNKVLGLTQAHLEASKNVKILTTNAKWHSVEISVRSYLSNLHSFLSKQTDPKMIVSIVTNTFSLVRYFAPFAKHTGKYLQLFLRLWSQGKKNVREEAFFALRQMAVILPDPYVDTVLKRMYATYVRNSKFTTEMTLPTTIFMANSISEIIELDLEAGYQQAFINIRQLAVHLKSALNAKSGKKKTKGESEKEVYNWQYVNSLRLWTKILCTHARENDDELYPLVYPLVQILTGVIQVKPTSRYFPLRIQCIRFLNQLSEHTRVYIPTAPYIVEMFQCSDLFKNFKPSSEKPPDLSLMLHVSNPILRTKQFQETLVTTALELLLKYFAIHSCFISFPEHILPILVFLKDFKKRTKVGRFKKMVTTCIQKLNANSKWVVQKRKDVSFSPADVKEVGNFLSQERAKQVSPLDQYIVQKAQAAAHADSKTKGAKPKQTNAKKRPKDTEEAPSIPNKKPKTKTTKVPTTKGSVNTQPDSSKSSDEEKGTGNMSEDSSSGSSESEASDEFPEPSESELESESESEAKSEPESEGKPSPMAKTRPAEDVEPMADVDSDEDIVEDFKLSSSDSSDIGSDGDSDSDSGSDNNSDSDNSMPEKMDAE